MIFCLDEQKWRVSDRPNSPADLSLLEHNINLFGRGLVIAREDGQALYLTEKECDKSLKSLASLIIGPLRLGEPKTVAAECRPKWGSDPNPFIGQQGQYALWFRRSAGGVKNMYECVTRSKLL